jgi:hypothetical protein
MNQMQEIKESNPSGGNGVEIFLGKGGQTFGPYTVAQYEAMRSQPEFRAYTFIWDGREPNADWKPLEAAPVSAPMRRGPGAPPPDSQTVKREPAMPPAANAEVSSATIVSSAPTRPVLSGYDVPGIEALCVDARHAVTGKLTQVTDSGCEFVTTQGASESCFGAKAQIMLNLLEPKTGRSMNVPARLSGVSRKGGKWSYRVDWKSCPELIRQHLEKAA